MKASYMLLAALWMAGAAGMAHAQENDTRGFYAFADVGQSSYAWSAGGGHTSTALRVGGGYNFIEVNGLTIGAEGALVDYGSSSSSSPDAFGGTTTGSMQSQGLLANAVADYSIPTVKGLGIFGKVGMAYITTNTSISSTTTGVSISGSDSVMNPFFGIGVRYDVNQHWAVRVQYEDFGSVTSSSSPLQLNLTLFSVGGVYKF